MEFKLLALDLDAISLNAFLYDVVGLMHDKLPASRQPPVVPGGLASTSHRVNRESIGSFIASMVYFAT